MAVYAAISPGENESLHAAIDRAFAGSYLKVGPGQYLISASKTTKQVADSLGAARGVVSEVLLMRVLNYTGWHAQEVWDWLADHLDPRPDPSAPSGEPNASGLEPPEPIPGMFRRRPEP